VSGGSPPRSARARTLERLGPDGAADVVDQYIDGAKRVQRGGHHLFGAGPGLQVDVDGDGLRPRRAYLGQHLLDQLRSVCQHQPGALPGERQRGAAPDALPGAGDDHRLPVETCGATHAATSLLAENFSK
jgi:hypothetical protein